MLWLIKSGNLERIIRCEKGGLDDEIIAVINVLSDGDKLGELISMVPLSGWTEDTAIEEIENAVLYMSTENLLRKYGKWVAK